MKKTIVLILSFVIVIGLCACGGGSSSDQPSTNNAYNSSQSSTSSKDELTEYEVESIATKALYKKIKNQFSKADPGSCTYKINKTEKNGKFYTVYGSVTLYDVYGKNTTGYSDGSGTPYRTFTIKINAETRGVASCDIR